MDTESTGQDQDESTTQSTDERAQGSRVEDVSGADARELEWQFEAADLKRIESWLEEEQDDQGGSGLSVAPGVTKNLTDTYYDTSDWMLYRAGYSLRIRQRGKSAEATMKSIAAADDGIRQRQEISESLENGEISTLRGSEGHVGERLRVLAGSKELEKLFEVKTHRRAFELSYKLNSAESGEDSTEGKALGEVALDETEIPLGRGEEPARLRRVEIETLPEDLSRDVRHFVEQMRSTHGLSSTRISKYEAGLYATGLVPDDQPDLGSTHVDASRSTGEVAYAVLRRQFARLWHHEPGVRLGEDPEEVHDMRVASRRMRAAIKLFSEALPERALWLESELKWLAGALGEVRDLDVELEELNAWAASEEADSEAFEDLIEAVEEQRSQARARMLETLDSARYQRLLASFAAMLRRGPAGSTEKGSKADTSITRTAPQLLSRRYKKFRKAAGRITEDDASVEDYHELRKKGKSLRYALEFHREVYGSPVKSLIRPLKSLQDDLGRHQDAVVGAEQLRGLSVGGERKLSSEAVFAMGSYAERYRREAAELRAEIPRSKAFRSLSNRSTQKELEKKLEKRS